jgi:hypothetical protein
MTTLDQVAGPRAAVRAPGLDRLRQVGAATALVLAPWGFVITNGSYTWLTRNGGSDENGAGSLALAASEPGLVRILVVAGAL